MKIVRYGYNREKLEETELKLQDLKAYELIKEEKLEDLGSVGYLFQHKKSGARISVISNDDENKVFYVGFRTPPKDSTGVPHIIEHTVLCGSKKFPVKIVDKPG